MPCPSQAVIWSSLPIYRISRRRRSWAPRQLPHSSVAPRLLSLQPDQLSCVAICPRYFLSYCEPTPATIDSATVYLPFIDSHSPLCLRVIRQSQNTVDELRKILGR